MAIEVNEADVVAAESFLTVYLSEKVPEASFEPGSAVRDICVNAMAYAFAFLRREISSVKARQSLKQLALLTPDEDADEAADDILSNFFITRKPARSARAMARLHFFSNTTSVTVPAGVLFTAANGQSFQYPGGASFTVTDLTERPFVTAFNTVITTRAADVELEALAQGEAGNVGPQALTLPAGTVSSFLAGEILGYAVGGRAKETTAELLARAPLALTTRNLVNAKSIKFALTDRIPGVSDATIISTGDAEMGRDGVFLNSGAFRMRIGGFVDVYVRLPRQQVQNVKLLTGAPYLRPDNDVVVLRDVTANFLAAGSAVVPGDLLNVTDGLDAAEVTTYVIAGVSETELTVDSRVPFSDATDETSSFVTYSVGNVEPAYDNKRASKTTGQTSRQIKTSNVVVLPPGAVYAIRSVKQGSTVLTRVNSLSPGPSEYTVICAHPSNGQSTDAVMQLRVGSAADGTELTINYETVGGLETVSSALTDAEERTAGTNVLAKAMHPVYVRFNVDYELLPNQAASVEAQAALNGQIQAWVANYFETNTNPVTASAMQTAILQAFPTVLSGLRRITYLYTLLAPDGQMFQYTSNGRLSVNPANDFKDITFTGASTLRNVSVFGRATNLATALADCTSGDVVRRTQANETLVDYLNHMGVSDRTVRYIALPEDITVAYDADV